MSDETDTHTTVYYFTILSIMTHLLMLDDVAGVI